MKLETTLAVAVVISLVASSSLPAAVAAEPYGTGEELKTRHQQMSYSLGLSIGGSLKDMPLKLDLAAFVRGVEDVLKGREPLLPPAEIKKVNNELAAKMKAAREKQRKELADKNSKAGKAFLSGNKKMEGVVTTASGLQYKVIKEGSGAKPKASDRVTVNYRGTLVDGAEFDSSYSVGRPSTFALNRVITGWTEAIQLMAVGSTYRFFIPSELAYGEHGAPGPRSLIGPNATLVFEVELVAIEK